MFETLGLLETNAKLLGGSLLAMLTTAATCTCAYLNNKLDINFGGSADVCRVNFLYMEELAVLSMQLTYRQHDIYIPLLIH